MRPLLASAEPGTALSMLRRSSPSPAPEAAVAQAPPVSDKKDSSECASRCGRRFDVLKAFQKDLKDVKRLQNDTKRLSKRTQGLFGTLQSCQEVPLAHVGWPDPCAPGPQSGPKTRMWRRFQRKRTKNTGAAALCRLLGGLRLAGLGRLSPHSSEPWRSQLPEQKLS